MTELEIPRRGRFSLHDPRHDPGQPRHRVRRDHLAARGVRERLSRTASRRRRRPPAVRSRAPGRNAGGGRSGGRIDRPLARRARLGGARARRRRRRRARGGDGGGARRDGVQPHDRQAGVRRAGREDERDRARTRERAARRGDRARRRGRRRIRGRDRRLPAAARRARRSAVRATRIQQALVAAADVPRRTAQAAAEIVALAASIVDGSNPNVVSDLAAAAAAARAALETALVNVEINAARSATPTITRVARRGVRADRSASRDRADAVVAAVRERLGRVSLIDGGPLAAAIRADGDRGGAARRGRRRADCSRRSSRPTTRRPRGTCARSLSGRGRVGIELREVELAADDASGVVARARRALGRPGRARRSSASPRSRPGCRSPEAGERIDPRKDVDGANPTSLGRLAAGLPAFAPATAQAVDRAPARARHRPRGRRGGRRRPLDRRRQAARAAAARRARRR